MSHPERSTAAVLAVLRSPVVGGGGGRSGPQAPAGAARQASERETGTRWVKRRAGPAPLRSGSRPRRIPPRVASRQPGPRPRRHHPKRDARPPGGGRRRLPGSRRRIPGSGPRRASGGGQAPSSGCQMLSSGCRTPGSGRRARGSGRVPGNGHRRARVGTRITASRGTAVRGTDIRETGSHRRPAADRKMDARQTGGPGTATPGTDGQGTGRGRMPDTHPKSGGGRGTTGGGPPRDQPVLIRRWRASKRPRQPPSAPIRKPFAHGVPITQRIRRLPARRQAQTRGLLSILAQNGARKG
jgi:hypothetical protein